MPIGVLCGNCGQQYQAPDTLAGKHVRCRQCAATIAIPGPVSLPAPPLLAPVAAVPNWQWSSGHGGARRSSQPLLIVAMLVCLAWAGFVCYESLRHIDRLAVTLDHTRGTGTLSTLLLLLLGIGEFLCAIAAVVAMGGMLARRSWSAMVGVLSTAIYFGMAWLAVPLGDLALAISLGLVDRPLVRASQMILYGALDLALHLIVPAVGLLIYARHDPLTTRRREWPCLRLLIGAACVGWALYATLNSWQVVDGMLTVLDMADKFNAAGRITASFWVMLLLRIGCLLAAVAILSAGVGILLRQDWSLSTCLIGSGAYLALVVIALIWALVEMGDRGVGANATLHFLIQLAKELVVPGCALGWSLWAQNADW